jgi:hypothetical protein
MEAEVIRHNITGSDTEVLEYRELDEVPREFISIPAQGIRFIFTKIPLSYTQIESGWQTV